VNLVFNRNRIYRETLRFASPDAQRQHHYQFARGDEAKKSAVLDKFAGSFWLNVR
jgi:hypothetical protein